MQRLSLGLATVIALGLAAAGMARAAEPAPSALPTGDAERGHKTYDARCGACHSLDANRVGPMHRGVYGRKAGQVAGFPYSKAVKESGVVWQAGTLDKWLTDPQAFIPGQRMNYRLSDPQLRADIIAYLQQQSGK